MRIRLERPPRAFRVGRDGAIELHDCGQISLEPDEQVTFVTPARSEFDVARKSWGFYATPSLNRRLPDHGLRAVLVKSWTGGFFVLLVESGHEDEFASYLASESQTIVSWLDTDEACAHLEVALRS